MAAPTIPAAIAREPNLAEPPMRSIRAFPQSSNSTSRIERSILFASAVEFGVDGYGLLDYKFNLIESNRHFSNWLSHPEGSIAPPRFHSDDEVNSVYCREALEHLTKEESWESEIWKVGLDLIQRRLLIRIFRTSHHLRAGSGYLVVQASDRTDSYRQQEKLKHLAHYDALTDLPNRQSVLTRIDQEIRSSTTKKFAVLFIDLDRFKQINDTLGHEQGDLLLVSIADRLRNAVRRDDMVGRVGGDEFVAILGNLNKEDEVWPAVDRLRSAFAEPVILSAGEYRVRPSIGVSFYPRDGETTELLLRHADEAMYSAKQAGRNQVAVFTDEMHLVTAHRFHTGRDLDGAVERGEFDVAYQPIISLSRNTLVGAEALVRWQHPTKGTILPGEFIGVAEDSGLVVEMGDFVLEKSIAWAARLHAGGQPIMVSVNLSIRQLLRADLSEKITKFLRAYNLPSDRLRLELTESVLIENFDRARDVIGGLKSLGISIALDDFGTGYSSLGYLRQFPVDVVKIDRAFIHHLEYRQEDEHVVAAIIHMAHSLGMRTIAEGVETEYQIEILKRLGCDMVQGYYYGRPVSAEQFATILTGQAS